MAKSFFSCFILMVTLFTSLCGYSQKPVVKTTLDKNEILIGEPFTLNIKILLPDTDYSLQNGGFPDSARHFVLIKKSGLDSSLQSDYVLLEQNIQLTSFDSGWVYLPRIEYVFKNSAEDAFHIATDSLRILVKYAEQDSVAPFHDIKDIIPVKNEKPWLKWILIALGALLLILILVLLIKKYRKKGIKNNFKDDGNAFEEAMKAITVLKKNMPQSNEDVKQFHSQLTDIFKRFLSKQIGRGYFQKTTDLILIDLKEWMDDKILFSEFANALRMSDAVKFAKLIPDAKSNQDCIQVVEKMIQKLNEKYQKRPNDI